MKPLLYNTSTDWLAAVLDDFDNFLKDHAAAEKKASGMAISMISHYPDRTELVERMSELAIEELTHYKEVIKLLHARGLQLGADVKDPYVIEFRKAIRNGPDLYLMDRLLIGGIIEARGAERFGLIAEGLPNGSLKNFYRAITNSEGRHHNLMIELAYLYLHHTAVDQRLDELLQIEAEICAKLPIRAALH